jgi:hypothetical protein
LSELATGVEVGQDEFQRRDLELRVDLNGDAAAIVTDGYRSVGVDSHLNARTISGQMFVDGVVQNLEDAVVKTTFIGIADVHAGTLANGFKAFQFVDLSGPVFLASCGILLFRDVAVVKRDDRFCGFFFSHGECRDA